MKIMAINFNNLTIKKTQKIMLMKIKINNQFKNQIDPQVFLN